MEISFANWLKIQMDRKCETAYRLSKEIGVSQSTVANWLNRKAVPQKAHVGKLAEHYDRSVEYIVELLQEV